MEFPHQLPVILDVNKSFPKHLVQPLLHLGQRKPAKHGSWLEFYLVREGS